MNRAASVAVPSFPAPPLVAALAGAILLVAHAYAGGEPWLPSYAFAWLFLLGLSLGAMILAALHDLTGGGWGVAARPALVAALAAFPVLAVLALPLALRPAGVLPWWGSAPLGQAWYLNEGSFAARALVYFAIWVLLAWLLRRPARSAGLAAIAFPLLALTTTFSAIDWMMSLSPEWHSTAFGLLCASGQTCAALCLAILAVAPGAGANHPQLRERLHDLGNLLLALILVWAYLEYMQFLIIWIEDLPDETGWYRERISAGWAAWAAAGFLLHFALPLPLLLWRRVKRSSRALGAVAVLVLSGCAIDVYWTVVPAFRAGSAVPRWSDLFALMAIGGCWLGWAMRSGPAMARHERPVLEEAGAGAGHGAR